MERLVAANEKGKKEMHATCKYVLEEFNKSDDKCPIVLDKLTSNIFSHYISTKKSKIPGVPLCYQLWWGLKFPHSYVSYERKDDGRRV